MDKLKNMLSSSHSKDEDVSHGNPNVGTSAGEGTHHTGGLGNSSTGNSSAIPGTDSSRHSGSAIPGTDSSRHTASGVPGTDSSRHTASGVPSHLSGNTGDAASTASIRSGVEGAAQPSGTSGNTLGHGHGEQGLTDRTLHQHAGPGHTFKHPQGQETPDPGYVHHTQGPHSTETANRLDPHVHIPGEFPAGADTSSRSHGHAGTGHTGTGLTGGALGGHEHERSQHETPLGRTAGFEEQRFDPSSRSHHTSESTGAGYPAGATTGSHDHHGRNAGLGGAAAGVGAAGAYEATHHGSTGQDPSLQHGSNTGSRAGATSQDPASFTTGRHESNLKNVLDPRELPQPEKMKSGTSTGHHTGSSQVDPNLSRSDKDHHYGRDAALAGGAGAAGVGAYESTHGHGTGSNTHGLGSNTHGTDSTHGIGSTGRDSTSHFGSNQPSNFKLGTTESHNTSTKERTEGLTDRHTTDKDHHHGRDAALAGGAGAAGVGAYESTHGHGTGSNTHGAGSNTHGLGSNTHGTDSTHGIGSTGRDGINDHSTNKDHHYGRDAALAGGAGTAGVGAYEATHGTGSNTHGTGSHGLGSNTHGTDSTHGIGSTGRDGINDHSATNKDHHYGRDAALVGGAGAVGAGGYEANKSHGLGAPQTSSQPLSTPTGAPHDARVFDQTHQVPDSKQTSGGWAADTKAQEKLQKERAKEAEKAHHKDEKAHEKALKDEKAHQHSADKGEKKHGILGFLHRDKSEPKDTPEERELKHSGNLREADEAAHLRHQRELEAAAASGTVGVAGASFEPSLREQQQQHHDASSTQGHNKLHKDPPASVQRELDERASSGVGAHGTHGASGTNDGIVTEPRTGLPMNVGKYGSGTGGTDGSSTIPGYQGHQGHQN